MSLFDRIRQKNKAAFQNEMPQDNYAKHEKKQTTHPMHEEGIAFRYAYCTLVAMAADIDMPINGMEVRLLTSFMESINLDGGIKEVLLHSNNQGEKIRESLSVMITEDYQKDVLYTDMIIMCLADSNKLSLKEQLFIENMEKLLNLPASHTESLKEYIQMRVRCQVREAETFIDELPKLKSFAQRANQYITSIISVINEPIEESTSGKAEQHSTSNQHGQNNKSNKPKTNKVLGIDFGTTYCCMAMIENGKPKIIPTQEGYYRTPSIVAFKNDGTYIVGDGAKAMALAEPAMCITSIKRQLLNDRAFKMGKKQYSPCEIAAIILHKLKSDAEAYLQQPIEDVVIAVPAYFSEKLRQVIKNAGSIAGFQVLGVINEANAAALGYGLKQEEEIQKVLVFDLGGGTYDVSILEISDGAFEVLAISGDGHLGGEDFDQALVDYLMDEFKKAENIDLKGDEITIARLKAVAEQAKIDLSTTKNATIDLPHIVIRGNAPVHLKMNVSRSEFNALTKHLVDRTIDPMKKALCDAKLKIEDIDKVILVGGSTGILAVQETVKRVMWKEPYRGVNPYEVVAAGAAIQGAILYGDIEDTLLLDVIPLSLGVETLGGVFTQIIERNTTIPTSKSHVFTTSKEDQTSIDVHILQGERPMASDNIPLGYLELNGIPPAPKGVPQIEVTFDIKSTGLINVSARDLGTGKTSDLNLHSEVVMSLEKIKQCQKNIFE